MAERADNQNPAGSGSLFTDGGTDNAATARGPFHARPLLRTPLRSQEQMEWIHDRFKIDGLERLARADRDYADSHGVYLPDVAALAHAALRTVEELRDVAIQEAWELEDGPCWCPDSWWNVDDETGDARPDWEHSNNCQRLRVACGLPKRRACEPAREGCNYPECSCWELP